MTQDLVSTSAQGRRRLLPFDALLEDSPLPRYQTLPGRAMEGFELCLLGGFDLRSNGVAFRVTQTAERLLALLAIQARPMLRLYVASSLWSDSSEEHANGSLRSALWRLGRAGHALVEVDLDHVRLSPHVYVDLYDVTERARRLLSGGPATDGDFAAIVPAVELLPDHYDDWVLIERERHRQLRMHALEELCRRLSTAGRHGEAIEAGLAAVTGEPLRESAHRALIQAHLAEGNRCEALRQFQRYRDVIRRELDLAPSPEIAAMVTERQFQTAAS